MVETSSSRMHFRREDTGDSGLAGGKWAHWQGVRVHMEHRDARELDLLGEDDSVGREVTMVDFFKCSTPLNNLNLTGSFTTEYELKGHLDWSKM